MTNKRNQLIFLLTWIAFNLLYYSVIPFCYDIVNYNANEENSTALLGCDFIDYNSQMIASYLDLTMRDILPFVLMSIFSILLILSIFRARMRVRAMVRATPQAGEIFKRDIRFSLMIILMNLLFIILSLPIAVVLFSPNYNADYNTFLFTYYIFYTSYAVNFYVMLITNTLFRNEVISFIFYKKPANLVQSSLQTSEMRN